VAKVLDIGKEKAIEMWKRPFDDPDGAPTRRSPRGHPFPRSGTGLALPCGSVDRLRGWGEDSRDPDSPMAAAHQDIEVGHRNACPPFRGSAVKKAEKLIPERSDLFQKREE